MSRLFALCLSLSLLGCGDATGSDYTTALNQLLSSAPDSKSATDDRCYLMPGLVLEMGSDQPLDNFPVCIVLPEVQSNIVATLNLPQAHHYLNVQHPIVIGNEVCSSGSNSTNRRLLGPVANQSELEIFVGIESICGAQGCEYRLIYFDEPDIDWCTD